MSGPLNVAHELLRQNIDRRGGRVALWHDEASLTYIELAARANRFGRLLLSLGVRPRERVVIQLPDGFCCVEAFLGCIQVGVWPVLVSPDLSQASRDFILRDVQAAALLTDRDPGDTPGKDAFPRLRLNVDDPALRNALAAAAPDLDPYPAHADDIAFLMYTSGSTGQPKGVPHRHRDMLFSADSYGAQVLGTTEQDCYFSVSKLFFVYGLGTSVFIPFRFGATAVLFSGKPTPTELFRIIARRRPTLFFAVPSLYSLLVQSFDDTVRLDSLRLCVSAGEALPAAVIREWQRLTGFEILDGMGSTEALALFLSNRPGQVRPGTSGCVVPPYEARIVTETGKPVSAGQPGQLMVRGRSTAPYYWNLPERTAETMLPEGWMKTGDIYTEEDGYFTYQGRQDDLFKVDARWVSPAQVENALREHPAVRECGVTWRKLEGLVKPVAFVVLNPGFAAGLELERELRLFARARLPEHACPVSVRFEAELPHTNTGKIQRFRLRETRSPEADLGSPGRERPM